MINYPNMQLGTFESFNEQDQKNFEQYAQIVHVESAEPSNEINSQNTWRSCHNLFSRSAVNLHVDENERHN